MRTTVIRALVAILAVCLLMTGCSLITVDPEMQAAEDAAAREKDYAIVLVDFADGSTITKGDVINVYNDNYSYYSYLYNMQYGTVPDDLAGVVKQMVLDSYTTQEIVKKHAADYGVELTEEMKQEAQESAQTEWDQTVDSYLTSNPAAEGTDEETARADAAAAMEALGYSLDYMVKEHTDTALVNAIQEKMTEDITEVPEERLQQAFDEKVEADKESYADATTYENALSNGTTIYWNPEGYRAVQHILVKPEDETLLDKYNTLTSELADLQEEMMTLTTTTKVDETAEEETSEEIAETSEETRDMATVRDEITAKTEEVNAAKDAIIASVQTTLDEISAKLEEGAAFPDLINDYTTDSDALFYVSQNTTGLVAPFKTAAMKLEKVGDISEPTVSQYGVHLIYYAQDVEAGEVSLESVKEALTAETLETLKSERITELTAQWTEEAGVTTHLDRWEDK